VTLTKFKGPPEPAIRQCRAHIDQVTSPDEHANLLAVTQVLARLRNGHQRRRTTRRSETSWRFWSAASKAEALETEIKAINVEARLEELLLRAAICRTLGSFRKQPDQ
jgi:hypothetical protein